MQYHLKHEGGVRNVVLTLTPITNQVPMNLAVSQFATVWRAGNEDDEEFPIRSV
jgi:hypothetical protein